MRLVRVRLGGGGLGCGGVRDGDVVKDGGGSECSEHCKS